MEPSRQRHRRHHRAGAGFQPTPPRWRRTPLRSLRIARPPFQRNIATLRNRTVRVLHRERLSSRSGKKAIQPASIIDHRPVTKLACDSRPLQLKSVPLKPAAGETETSGDGFPFDPLLCLPASRRRHPVRLGLHPSRWVSDAISLHRLRGNGCLNRGHLKLEAREHPYWQSLHPLGTCGQLVQRRYRNGVHAFATPSMGSEQITSWGAS